MRSIGPAIKVGVTFIVVAVLGCTSDDSRYADTRNLFRWAWRERSAKP